MFNGGVPKPEDSKDTSLPFQISSLLSDSTVSTQSVTVFTPKAEQTVTAEQTIKNNTGQELTTFEVTKSGDDDNKSVQESLALIYSNKSLVFNEISSTNFMSFWKRLKPLMKENINEDIKVRDDLYKMVIIKDSVAEYIWYMLTGLLVCSVSYNYLSFAKCDNSISDMEKKLEKYSELMTRKKDDTYTSKKSYVSTEGT